MIAFTGERGVEQTTAREQNDHDADRGGDHVLRVPDADGRDDAHRVRVRTTGKVARILREPRPAHHIQLSHGGERRVQLHVVLRHEPQVPAHAHDHVHAVSGGPSRAQRNASVVGQLPAVRHNDPAQHGSHANDRHRDNRRRRQTRTARPGRQQGQQQQAAKRHRRRLKTISIIASPFLSLSRQKTPLSHFSTVLSCLPAPPTT